MKEFLKSTLAKALAPGNVFPTRITDKNDIESLIINLYPVSTDKKLIRFGPNSDGGYLLPDDLQGIEACFSPGVSFVSGFEKECADRGIKVFLADKSVESPVDSHPLFHFTKKFVGVTTNDEFMTIDDWVNDSLPNSQNDLLLQIDIEGFEYEVFLAMSDKLLNRFRIIVAEFHQIDNFWSKPFFNIASRAFYKILQTHTCLHIHPNNNGTTLNRDGLEMPQLLEFTFLRNDRFSKSDYRNDFPHHLDFDNVDGRNLVLGSSWYKQ